LQTEFEFTLPKGYVGDNGELHRVGTMRLATARDEIEPLRDRSIDGPDDPYLTSLVLARVITSLGSLPEVGVTEVEGLFAADLAFLQDLYGIINFGDQADVEALQASVLPEPESAMPVAAADVAFDDAGTTADELMVDGTTDRSDELSDEGAPRRRGRVEEVTSVSTS
jgi:hypothetical protein